QRLDDFRQIAAGLPLKIYRGDEELHVHAVHPVGAVLKRLRDGESHRHFVKGPFELRSDRIGKFLADQFHADEKGVPGMQGSGDEFQRLWKLPMKFSHALSFFSPEIEEWNGGAGY